LCAGSAPGTAFDATGAVVDGEDDVAVLAGVVEEGFGDSLDERCMYHALPSATPSTARIIRNGRIFFMS